MDLLTPGVFKLLQRIGAILLCCAFVLVVTRVTLASIGPAPSGNRQGTDWFGPLAGLGDLLGYGIVMLVVGAVGFFACVICIAFLIRFGFAESARWSYAGYPALVLAILWAMRPAGLAPDVASAPTTPSRVPIAQPQSPAPPIPHAPSVAPKEEGDDAESRALLGIYAYPQGEFTSASKKVSNIPGVAKWPFIAYLTPPGTTLEAAKSFFSGIGVSLSPLQAALVGNFNRPGDQEAAQIMVAEATKGEYSGRVLVLYQLKSVSVDRR